MWDGSAVFCRRTLSVYLCIWSTLLGSAVLFPSDSDHSVNTICCALSMSSVGLQIVLRDQKSKEGFKYQSVEIY